MAKKTDLTKLSVEEINKMIEETREEIRERRFNIAGAGAKDTSVARKLRVRVAQLLTELRSRK